MKLDQKTVERRFYTLSHPRELSANNLMKFKNCFTFLAFLALLTSFAFADTPKRNVVFILSDDHRFDFMGFTGKLPWLKTPHMVNMAQQANTDARARMLQIG